VFISAKNLIFRMLTPEQRFRRIYKRNQWGSAESVSGRGSELAATKRLREALIQLVRERSIQTIIDVPCGDFNWMQHVVDKVEVDYTGIDIVDDIVRDNSAKYGAERIHFQHGDLCRDRLPKADLVISRDCFIHLSYADTFWALDNLRASCSRYLLASTYPGVTRNNDIATGRWRFINLALPPYGLPEPELKIAEDEPGKEMWLWKLQDLPQEWKPI
jgi:SAM-dependent methyltransferase